MSDTIYALATPAGRGAVAVMRISGGRTRGLIEAMAGGAIEPRRASLRRLRDPVSGVTLDQALVLWFPAPASYSGEDVAELHLHGSVAVVEAVSRTLAAQGLRLAEAGEFTRRAFENARLDLTEAEGVADLIDAQTDAQRRQALRQMGGGLSDVVGSWREDLLQALALLEAAVDFPDEGLPDTTAAAADAPLRRLRDAAAHAAVDVRGEQVRKGYRVALVGPPNAGKSSLFNALVERDAAIVSARPGTTRDVVEAYLTLAGHAVILADTAGIDEATHDEIEREGMRRARDWAKAADLRLHLGATDEDGAVPSSGSDWVVRSKSDLPATDGVDASHCVSVVTGEGIERLRRAIAEAASHVGGEPIVTTRARHREAFTRMRDHLDRALEALAHFRSPELAAEDVRLAARTLEALSGRIDAEDVLGRVFSSFCIGK